MSLTMSAVPERTPSPTTTTSLLTNTGSRASLLAARLEAGARALAELANGLTDAEWQTPLPGDGRKVGVVIHHVASVYPLEIQIASTIGRGEPLVGVTMNDVHAMNARHAVEQDAVTKTAALQLLLTNSTEAAAAIRALDDASLDRAAMASLYDDAPVTCQFVLEDHAVRHSYHHLAVIERALNRRK